MIRGLAGLAICVLIAAPASADVVSATARARAKTDGRVAVLVALHPSAEISAAADLPARRAAVSRQRVGLLRSVPKGALRVTRRFRTLAGFAATVTPEGLEALAARPEVWRVDVDPVGTAALHNSVPQIRADRVHARGVRGEGTVIAVVDSGVEADHPDIAEALLAEECFCRGGEITPGQQRRACCPGRRARASGPGSAASADRHGPHVTGIALSRGHVSGIGMAPAAQLVAIRVLDDDNLGFLSDWIAAIDWLAAERPEVRIINMSLVSQLTYGGDCERVCNGDGCAANALFGAAIDMLWERDTMVFAAAGNNGRPEAMGAPACVGQAVAIGAVDGADAVASFSNSSPGLDLLAPGVSIVSDGLDGALTVISGTSMAAPHVSGLAALLLSARPGLTAPQLVDLLAGTGVPVVDSRTGRIRPRIDAFAALQAASTGTELARGGGSRTSDCLLEWSVVPAEAVRREVVRCVDNDPFCDVDQELGRCTFALSMCFNMRDPMLRNCSTDEPLQTFAIFEPPLDAPLGSVDRQNLDSMAAVLPDFPLDGHSACSLQMPFTVQRPGADQAGIGRIRMRVSTATRRDYDHIALVCDVP